MSKESSDKYYQKFKFYFKMWNMLHDDQSVWLFFCSRNIFLSLAKYMEMLLNIVGKYFTSF